MQFSAPLVSVGIIGKGNIGKEVYRRVVSKGWDVKWVADSNGFFCGEHRATLDDYSAFLKGLDVVFLAIPTMDSGETAYNYIRSCLNANVPIVTCEKGALSNYFSELEEAVKSRKSHSHHFLLEQMLGYSAAVGGGTRMLPYLSERNSSRIEEIHAVINGTLNYIFDELSLGKNLEETVQETQRLGYAEPGAKSALEVLNKEAAGDIPMKAAILFNHSNLAAERIRAEDISVKSIEPRQLSDLMNEAKHRRYIVSIIKQKTDVNNADGNREYSKREDRVEREIIGGFEYQAGDWHLSAGFREISENPLFCLFIPHGVNNALLIAEGEEGKDGVYVLTGPGAGSSPTAAAMLRDAEKILNINLT